MAGTYAVAIHEERHTGSAPPESERLARLYFSYARRGDVDKLLAMLHPDVEIVLKTSPEILRGREQVEAFVEGDLGSPFNESQAVVYRPLDHERIVVEGRLRWMDDRRVLRDDPMIWALEFRDGLLRRSTPAHTVLEAEALLATSL
jgi:ketosteroid isomerase-like protein